MIEIGENGALKKNNCEYFQNNNKHYLFSAIFFKNTILIKICGQ